MMNYRTFLQVAFFMLFVSFAVFGQASDKADDSDYNSGWTNGLNGGSGFGAWSLTTSGTAGHFIGNSTNNGNQNDTNADGDINSGTNDDEAWGLFANTGGEATAVRAFSSALTVGQVFSISMDNGFVDSGTPTVGFSLRNANSETLFEFFFRGGQTFYEVNDLNGVSATNIGFTDEGLNIQFTLTDNNSYQVTIFDIKNNLTVVVTGDLMNPANGQTISELRLFNFNAGANSTNDAFFNKLSISNTVAINEFLADPTGAGDANGDGSTNSSQDEFIEIVNNTGSGLNLSNWTLSDKLNIRHTFPNGTIIPNQCAVIIFGGGTPTGNFGNVFVQVASSGGVSLNNTGDDIILKNDNGDLISSYTYGNEANDNQSITRDPDFTGSFVKHSLANNSNGNLFSPGTKIDGTSFSGCSADVTKPELANTLFNGDNYTATFIDAHTGIATVDVKTLTNISSLSLDGTTVSGSGVFTPSEFTNSMNVAVTAGSGSARIAAVVTDGAGNRFTWVVEFF